MHSKKHLYLHYKLLIQPDGGPLGAKHVAYDFTKNALSLLIY